MNKYKRQVPREWLYYERLSEIGHIIYPPVLYMFIIMLVKFVGDIIISVIYSKSLGKFPTAQQSLSYLDNIQELTRKASIYFTLASGIIGLLVFTIIYIREKQSGLIRTITIEIKEIKSNGFNMILKLFLLSVSANLGFSRLVSLFASDKLVQNYEESQSYLLSANIILQIITIAIITPAVEELIYRGILQERLSKIVKKNSFILSGIVFGFFHFDLYQGIYAAIVGMMFGYIYDEYGSLIYCILIHGMANLCTIINYNLGITGFINNSKLLYIIVMIGELGLAGKLLFNLRKNHNIIKLKKNKDIEE